GRLPLGRGRGGGARPARGRGTPRRDRARRAGGAPAGGRRSAGEGARRGRGWRASRSPILADGGGVARGVRSWGSAPLQRRQGVGDLAGGGIKLPVEPVQLVVALAVGGVGDAAMIHRVPAGGVGAVGELGGEPGTAVGGAHRA